MIRHQIEKYIGVRVLFCVVELTVPRVPNRCVCSRTCKMVQIKTNLRTILGPSIPSEIYSANSHKQAYLCVQWLYDCIKTTMRCMPDIFWCEYQPLVEWTRLRLIKSFRGILLLYVSLLIGFGSKPMYPRSLIVSMFSTIVSRNFREWNRNTKCSHSEQDLLWRCYIFYILRA